HVARKYLEEVYALALKLAGAISESLGLNKDYIEISLCHGLQIVANNYYPPCLEPDRMLGVSPHSNHEGLVILIQNDVDGLQIKHGEDWVAVRHIPGTFVVNLGDYLEKLSNGKYKSVEHRAVANNCSGPWA
ncbi:Isopenicillin N synthase-like, Fe(2+) 2OG dioxygenase domain, partial [Dillenia turbinata]